MPHVRLAVAAVVALLAAAGCGGETEADRARDALARLAHDVERADGAAVCRGVTPQTRRTFDAIARGWSGGDCAQTYAGRRTAMAAYGIRAADLDGIEDTQIRVDGDTAWLTGRRGDEPLAMRKVRGRWLLDLVTVPDPGYELRATAACTELEATAQRRPLPAPTRPAMAREARWEAAALDRLARELDRGEPPAWIRDVRPKVVAGLRASARDWRRAAAGLRGRARPVRAYVRALDSTAVRTWRLREERRDLGVRCLGKADAVPAAREYRRVARRICARAVRDAYRVRGPRAAVFRRVLAIVRRVAARLRRLDAPLRFAALHRRSAAALAHSFDALPRLLRSHARKRAVEKYELLSLRSRVGFARIGLDRCARL